jgi:hypothetical protein
MKLNIAFSVQSGCLNLLSRRLDEALRHQEHALGRMPPNRHALVEQADLRVRHRDRIAHHFRHQFEESAPHGRGHCQTKFYTASWRSGAGWSATVFAHESPTRSARFDAENDLY